MDVINDFFTEEERKSLEHTSAVIIDIDEYQEILERLEDVEDLKMLEEIRKKPLKFRRLEDFLKEYSPVM